MSAALITGASTGIGRELAGLFAADGVDVVVVSSERSVAELTDLAEELRARNGVRVDTVTMDLATPGAGGDLVARVDELGVDVGYLVNNAGVGILGLTVQDSDPDAVSRMVQLNVVTTTDLTLLYAGRMAKAGRGAILNVGSIAAYVIPHGLEAGYAASKAYVRSFSECVAHDLRGTGVTCTHLAPGPTRTEFMGTAGLGRHVAAGPVLHGRRAGGKGGLRRDAGRAGQRGTRGGYEDHARHVGDLAVAALHRRLVGPLREQALIRQIRNGENT